MGSSPVSAFWILASGLLGVYSGYFLGRAAFKKTGSKTLATFVGLLAAILLFYAAVIACLVIATFS